MGPYIEAIKRLERERNALDQALRAAFQARDQSALKRQEWEMAAERFRNHRSALDPLIDSCLRGAAEPLTPELRDFMFDYILADPQFFRSGYLMERILRRVKPLPLSGEEKRLLQTLLLNRMKVKARRNFRNICRLIPVMEDSKLRAEVDALTHSQDAAISHRAAFARAYFSR